MQYRISLHTTFRRGFWCFAPLCVAASLMSQDQPKALTSSAVRATVVLGLEGVSKNASGELLVQDESLVFRQRHGSTHSIPVTSIKDVFLSQEDKEVGGTPMAVSRAAAPFGGGRVVGLFSHKNFDFITLTYLDSNGGFHGAICQLKAGDGNLLENELERKGVRVTRSIVDAKKTDAGEQHEVK
jgi:hypothetical protein